LGHPYINKLAKQRLEGQLKFNKGGGGTGKGKSWGEGDRGRTNLQMFLKME